MLLFGACRAQSRLQEARITPQELTTWQTLDLGKAKVQGNELIMEETEGSNGYFLISPERYRGDLQVNYQVKALSESSVCILLLFVSDSGVSEELTLPPMDAKGRDFWDWRTQLEHYNLTFNNSSHGYKPFFFKNISPVRRGFYQTLPESIMKAYEWNTVEVGRRGNYIWFKLNDDIVFEQEDCNPLPGGHLIFRISGTTGEEPVLAKIALKDLVITHE